MALCVALVAPAVAAQPSAAIELLRRSPDAGARARAAEALGRLRPAGARAALESALDDHTPAVRAASAQALESMDDPAATAALNRHALDHDASARDAVMHAIHALMRRMPAPAASAWTSSAGAAPGAPSTPASINWRRVRVLIRLGTIANNVSTDPYHVLRLGEAVRATVSEDERFAMHPGSLPSSVISRVRRGSLRTYSLEGSLTTLREASVGSSRSVRAEVSLVLVSEPSHSIAAMLSGSATAQEAAPMIAGLPDPLPRLRVRAIEGAVHGALRTLETELLSRRSSR